MAVESLPGTLTVVHRSFESLPALERNACTKEEGLARYRRVRDEMRRFVESLPEGFADRLRRMREHHKER